MAANFLARENLTLAGRLLQTHSHSIPWSHELGPWQCLLPGPTEKEGKAA